MDRPSGLKRVLYQHGHALYEGGRHSHLKDVARTAMYMGLIGFLITLGLLKWVLLPPLPEGVHPPTLAPRFITDRAPAAALASAGKDEAAAPDAAPRITPAPNPFRPSAAARASEAFGNAANASAANVLQWKAPPVASYWIWLKPLLISAEVIPVMFFLWIALRAYQISYRKRDWVMALMGAQPDDISRLLYYRAGLVALGAAGLGIGSFVLISILTQDVPALPMQIGWGLVGIMLVTGLILSAVAYRFPPDEGEDPML